MGKREDNKTIKRMKEIKTLLNEFNADLSGYDPGVTAYIHNVKSSNMGAGYWGEHLAFNKIEWNWLEPILKELSNLRKKC